MNKLLFSLLSLTFLLVGCNTETSSSSWAFQFVKYNDQNYVPTKENVSRDDLEKKIGKVETFLDEEQDSSNLSSNAFDEGTEIYSIQGDNVNKAIAVVDKDGKVTKLKVKE